MNEVTRENFSVAYPKLEAILKESSFVCVDLEFLGLPQAIEDARPSILDSPAERYAKNFESVRRFPPCQLGLSIYTETNGGKSYDIHVYRVYLFKELHGRNPPSFGYDSMAFLNRHDFDFNKWVKTGVTHANRTELDRMKERISDGVNDCSLFDEHFCQWLDRLRAKICSMAPNAETSTEPDLIPQEERTEKELCLDLRVPIVVENGRTDGFRTEVSLPKPLSKLESAAVLYDLTLRYPSVTFRLEKGDKLHFKPFCHGASHQQRIADARHSLLDSICGASQIVRAISELRKPLVMHNSSLDVLYLCHYFLEDMPEDYRAAKRRINHLFPSLVDTKYLAIMCTGILRDRRPELLGKLGGLRTYIEMESNGTTVDYSSPKLGVLFSTKDAIRGRSCLHDASFDSMITGEVFLKLAHVFAIARGHRQKLTVSSDNKPSVLSFRDLLYEIRPYVVNRVPLSFNATQFVNLSGEDTEPSDYYRLALRRKDVGTNNPLTAAILRMLGRPSEPVFSTTDEQVLRQLLEKFGAKWRCDIRLEEQRTRALVACCNQEVYAAVFGTFATHALYEICEPVRARVARKSSVQATGLFNSVLAERALYALKLAFVASSLPLRLLLATAGRLLPLQLTSARSGAVQPAIADVADVNLDDKMPAADRRSLVYASLMVGLGVAVVATVAASGRFGS